MVNILWAIANDYEKENDVRIMLARVCKQGNKVLWNVHTVNKRLNDRSFFVEYIEFLGDENNSSRRNQSEVWIQWEGSYVDYSFDGVDWIILPWEVFDDIPKGHYKLKPC